MCVLSLGSITIVQMDGPSLTPSKDSTVTWVPTSSAADVSKSRLESRLVLFGDLSNVFACVLACEGKGLR